MAFSTHDIVPDSPTNNFATLNPLNLNSSHSEPTDGNLKITGHSTYLYNGGIYSNMSISKNDSNLYYAEFACLGSVNSTGYFRLGIGTDNYQPTNSGAQSKPDVDSNGIGFEASGTSIISNNTNVFTIATSFSAPDTTGIWQILVKGSTGEVWFGKNNNLLNSGSPVASISGDYNHLSFFIEVYTPSDIWCANFGQDPSFAGNKSPTTTYTDANGIGAFYYQPPTGAKALCTANLPDFTPTVTGDTPQEYFKAVTYTGNGTGQSITGVGFQPDLVWIKNRDQADGHRLFTSSTGVHNYFQTDSASTGTSTTSLTSFNSTGFSIGTEATVNTSGEKYVACCWAAGSSETNNDGTIQSTIRRNVNSGISIVQYTGNGIASSTVGHGLSTVDCILGIQNISGHIHFPNILGLNFMQISSDSNAASDAGSSGTFGNFTSSTFGFRSGLSNIAGVNNNGSAYTVLVFQNVEGFSKIGSYTGNGSPDGPFVYCGFRPAFVMIKPSSASGPWLMFDNGRDTFNQVNQLLRANTADNETGSGEVDLLSNGFKYRGSSGNVDYYHNQPNVTYIFMSFAEQPFKYANAR